MSDKKPRSLRKRFVVAALVVIALALAIKWVFFRQPFLYAGTLEVTKVDLSSRLASAINKVTVQEGARIREGEVLATLVCDDIKVASELANINYNRALRLRKAGTVTQESLDLARNQKESADVHLSWCTITSPIHGKVLSRYHEPGEWVNVGTKLLTLANVRDIWAYIYVTQPDIGKLKVGEKLKGYLPELNGRDFTGTIIKINEEAEFTPKNVQTRSERARLVYGVKVSFLGSNEEEILKPGMTIEMELP